MRKLKLGLNIFFFWTFIGVFLSLPVYFVILLCERVFYSMVPIKKPSEAESSDAIR
jgi:hypothetical protein